MHLSENLQLIIILKLIIYATDRSKVLCLYYGAPRVLNSSCALCPRVSSILFSTVITSLGKEGPGLCVSRAFVCLFYVYKFLSFSFPLGVRCWLRIVIVAL